MLLSRPICPFFFFFFNDTATTEIYTLSLHDALPICYGAMPTGMVDRVTTLLINAASCTTTFVQHAGDRKSTRLNSSHLVISYAVFCLKKKKKTTQADSPKDTQSLSTSPRDSTSTVVN